MRLRKELEKIIESHGEFRKRNISMPQNRENIKTDDYLSCISEIILAVVLR